MKYEDLPKNTRAEWFINVYEDELKEDFISYSDEYEKAFLEYIKKRFDNITEDEIKQIELEINI